MQESRPPVAVRRVLCASALVTTLALCLAGAPKASADPTLFRVILKDGTAVSSFGEFARVGDRIVFSMPMGPISANPPLQLVSLPASAVDWDATAQYTEAVRYACYVETRAEEDYAALTGEIANAISELSLSNDPVRRLEIAERARRTLVEWPGGHFGYRSADVREMVALIDEVISELRAAAGASAFDLSLVAVIEPPSMPLLPEPTLAQTIEQALTLVSWLDKPAERTAVLRSALALIDASRTELPPSFVRDLRTRAATALKLEVETDRAYARLARRTVMEADRRAADADVRGLERMMRELQQRDAQLGAKRPDEMAALLAALGEKLDAARRLRLAKDRWTRRSPAILAYRDRVADVLKAVDRLRPHLEDIRSLAGPAPAALSRLRRQVEAITRQISRIVPPPELEAAHALLVSACHLAREAADARERAIDAEDLQQAWNASAAAAGSMMLVAQARGEMERQFQPPEIR